MVAVRSAHINKAGEFDPEKWKFVIDVNLCGFFNTVKNGSQVWVLPARSRVSA